MVTERIIELLRKAYADPTEPDAIAGACDDGTYDHQWRETEELGCQECGSHSGVICDVCMASADAVWEYELYAAIRDMMRAGAES